MSQLKEQTDKYYELVETLVTKSWASPSFKQQLISNPETTIGEIIGKPMNPASNMKVVVEDQTDSTKVYLNIPQKPNFEGMELSDAELELIAGGTIINDAGYWVGQKLRIAYDFWF